MVVIESNRKKRENILKKYTEAVIADVTGNPCGIGENMGGILYQYLGIILRRLRAKKGNCGLYRNR